MPAVASPEASLPAPTTANPGSPKGLRDEANDLRYLLDRFLDDRRFLSQPGAHIVCFVDSHELVSFIKPNEEHLLRGFGFEAERVATNDLAAVLAELGLKNEQILRKILFDGTMQKGLLPSHGEEIDEEYIYHQLAWAQERVRLLETAWRQLDKLRDNSLAQRFLAEVHRHKGIKPETKRLVLNFVRNAAPALMTLLTPDLSSPKARIDALINESRLVGFDDFDWSSVGLTEQQAGEMRYLRPSRAAAERWCDYLAAHPKRDRNSSRANRIDGQAIALLELINERLAELTGGQVRACLITRAMTLINATRDEKETRRQGLKAVDFARHPRLLMFPDDMSGGLSDDLIRTLTVALDTFAMQLSAQDCGMDNCQEASRNFVDTWKNFEHARMALGLQSVARSEDRSEAVSDATLKKILAWFASELDVRTLILEELRAALHTFGLNTFTQGASDHTPIAARVVQLDSPPRASVCLLGAGVRGPVEFSSPELRHCPDHVDVLENVLGDLATPIAERYLGWSLLHAGGRRWKLAAIYARAVLEVHRILPHESSARAVHEAQLLLVQVQRLGRPSLDPERLTAAAHSRFEIIRQLLHDFTHGQDPRVLYEGAAQILESFLMIGAETQATPPLAEGVAMLEGALEHLGMHDGELLHVRILELLVTYAIAARRHPETWPASLSDRALPVKAWHSALHELLTEQRTRLDAEDIPRRSRAVEIIGFMLESDERTAPNTQFLAPFSRLLDRPDTEQLLVPFELKNFTGKLYKDVKQSPDAIGQLLAHELNSIKTRLERFRIPDLIYAPLWSNVATEEFIASLASEELRGLARNGFRVLELLGGPQQRGIEDSDAPPLQEAARAFDTIVERLPESGCDPASRAHFICRMEAAYARLLHALINKPEKRKRIELNAVADDYRRIISLYPRSSISHFRLSIVLDLLHNEDESRAELDHAAKLLDADPYLSGASHHWVCSTIVRRRAHNIVKDAQKVREALQKEHDGAQHLTQYLGLIRQAFAVVHDGFSEWEEQAGPPRDGFAAIERLRRINNVVYYSALYLEARSSIESLGELGYSEALMRGMLAQLHGAGGINDVPERSIVHTIGYARWVLGEPELARQAGKRLLEMLVESDRPASAEELASSVNDVRRWRTIPIPRAAA
jgi:hypothetical protein